MHAFQNKKILILRGVLFVMALSDEELQEIKQEDKTK